MYTLPELPYPENALEPVISREIMNLHRTKHHKAYVDNLNKALDAYTHAEKNSDVAAMIALQAAIKFNGGGHVNHSLFWKNLAPVATATVPSSGAFFEQICKDFGSLDKFKEIFNAKTLAIQGSGWGWLGFSKESKGLIIATTANQDPLSTLGLIPLLGIDVWEHAYYIDYKNVRADYLKNIWQVVNWGEVEARFKAAQL